MANKLTDLNIREVAFCRKGMNQNAVVALYKADLEKGSVPGVPHPHAGNRVGMARRAPALQRLMAVRPHGAQPIKVRTVKEDDPEVEEFLKRDFSDDERKKLAGSGDALPDGSFPIQNTSDLENAIRAIGRAKDPAKAKAHIISRAKALGATDKIPDEWKGFAKAFMERVIEIEKAAAPKVPDGVEMFDDAYAAAEIDETADCLIGEVYEAVNALCGSICSIKNDDSGADRMALLRVTFDQFKTHIQGLVPDDLEKGTSGAEGDDMSKAIAKALGLPEDADEATVLAAITKRDEDAAAALAKAAEDAAIAKMSDKHKAYASAKGMKGDDLAKFAAKSPEDREAAMASSPVAKTADEIALAKAAEENVQLKKDVADLKKTNDIASIRKEIDSLKFMGDLDAKAETLYKLRQVDEALAKAMLDEWKATNEQLSKSDLFKDGGRSTVVRGDALESITKLATEMLAKDPGLKTIAKAREEVRKAHPELVAAEQEQAAKRAA